MRRSTTLLFLISLFTILQSCSNKSSNGYTINGKIEGLENGVAILAKLDLVSNERVNVDSTKIINGKYNFKGKVESPYLHTIFINTHKINFFLENSNINIISNIKDIENSKVIGSKEDSLFKSYTLDEIFDRKKGMEIMLKYPDYSFAAFTTYYQFQIFNIDVDTLETIMHNFKESVKKSVYYKHLSAIYPKIKKVAISQPAPEFEIYDTKGTIFHLSDAKGKYVLLDFWASWCAPCRANNPALVEIYNTFSTRNFTILGISVDKNKESWLKAIKDDQLPWLQLSNLEGWGKVSNTYGVKAVPQNFLLDPKGKIIDKNIEIKDLSKKLEKLLPK